MDRDTLLAAIAALLGVGAVGIAAASLEERREERVGFGGDGGAGLPGGSGEPAAGPVNGLEVPYLMEAMMVLLSLVLLLGVVYLVLNYRAYLPILLAAVGVVALVALLAALVSTGAITDGGSDRFAENETVPGVTGGGLGEPSEARWLPALVLLGVFGVVLLAAIALGLRDDDEATEAPSPTGTAAADPDLGSDLAAVAGRVANRLENPNPYENEVYRAWVEMTDLLDVANRETATPREFAREAVGAGMDPADVRDLTQLFEEVRYGDQPVTGEREEGAAALFRRIEERYGETG